MTREEFAREWVRCGHWLQDALDAGGNIETLDQVRRSVEQGHALFWPAEDAAIVTTVLGVGLTTMVIYLAGGSLSRLEAMLPVLEHYAWISGCTRITLSGRLGWQRTFLTKRCNYRVSAITLSKEL